MTVPFTDSGQMLQDFSETIYVRCPACDRRAIVKRIEAEEGDTSSNASDRNGSQAYQRIFHARKLSCLHCSHARQSPGGSYGGQSRVALDPFFHLSLWLQTPCCGEILWAYNEEHVRFLEQFIAAKQREKFHVPGRIRNATMASRLPLWMKSGHNRAELLKGVERLKHLLDEQ